jgi:protein-S-isoprenylcysteine O-methyltransferase Ste14
MWLAVGVIDLSRGRAWTLQTRAVLYVRATAALALPLAVDVVVPAALVRNADERIEFGVLFFLGAVLIVSGSWLLLDSVFVRFAHEGRGTLAPIDPPRFVVRGGAYRVVRNPMYVANVAIVLGSAAVFGAWELAAWAAVVLVAFHLFVVIYEEPTLKRTFGESYESYRRDVDRWVPHRLGVIVRRPDRL